MHLQRFEVGHLMDGFILRPCALQISWKARCPDCVSPRFGEPLQWLRRLGPQMPVGPGHARSGRLAKRIDARTAIPRQTSLNRVSILQSWIDEPKRQRIIADLLAPGPYSPRSRVPNADVHIELMAASRVF